MSINLLPDTDLEGYLQEKRQAQPNQLLKNTLSRLLPKRFIEIMIENNQLPDTSLAQLSNERITQITTLLQAWLV
ncbi:aminoacetone oxidase family FAD-binding enzyme, partial [Proteus mirabilis]